MDDLMKFIVEISLGRPAREDALLLHKLTKVEACYRAVLQELGAGSLVSVEDARLAIFAAMGAAVTAKGQSSGRRTDRDAAQRLWFAVHDAAGLSLLPSTAPIPPEPLDLSNREQVEQWLET